MSKLIDLFFFVFCHLSFVGETGFLNQISAMMQDLSQKTGFFSQ